MSSEAPQEGPEPRAAPAPPEPANPPQAAARGWRRRLDQANALLRAAFLSALCVILPLLIYFQVLPLVLDGLVNDFRTISNLDLEAAPESQLTGDFETRMQYGLGAALVILLAIAALTHALVTFWRRRGPLLALAAFVVSVIGGGATYLSDEHVERRLKDSGSGIARAVDQLLNCDDQPVWSTMRGLAYEGQTKVDVGIARTVCDRETIGEKMRSLGIDRVLRTVRSGPAPPEPATLDAIMELAAVTAAFGVAGLLALTLRFAELAWRGPPGSGKVPGHAARLRARWRGFRTTLLLAALVLTVSVVANREFYQWPLTLLTRDSAEAYGPTSAAAAAFWGTLYTLILLSVAVPAALALYYDISEAAHRVSDDPEAQTKWLKANDLALNLPEGVSGALAAAAPLFASPLIDAIKGGIAAAG